MRILLIHRHGLAGSQFMHLAPALAARGHQVAFLQEARGDRKPGDITSALFPGRGGRLDQHCYARVGVPDVSNLPLLSSVAARVARAEACLAGVRRVSRMLGTPDVVLAHSGWGDDLLLRDALPDTRLLCYGEYYFGATLPSSFDPEYRKPVQNRQIVHLRNGMDLLSLHSCSQMITPTHWQKASFPAELQHRFQVIHEGIDTREVRPDPQASLQIGAQCFRAGEEIVTYVARNLEPYRGFHAFMRSLPLLQALRPQARVICVGAHGHSYSDPCPGGISYLEHYRRELGDRVDWSRVHFTGKLAREEYLKVLQVSAAHVYLTYPFVLSWSMLEAMSAGCLLLGSATGPVEEVLRHGENGLLVDFFDHQALARQLAEVLANPAAHTHLRTAARQTVLDRYDRKRVCLPQMLGLLGA